VDDWHFDGHPPNDALAANARGKLDERLARWILMAHDRVGSDTLALTHESIALLKRNFAG
jgi:hypothetical protein